MRMVFALANAFHLHWLQAFISQSLRDLREYGDPEARNRVTPDLNPGVPPLYKLGLRISPGNANRGE